MEWIQQRSGPRVWAKAREWNHIFPPLTDAGTTGRKAFVSSRRGSHAFPPVSDGIASIACDVPLGQAKQWRKAGYSIHSITILE